MDFLCVFPVILPFEPNMLAKAKTNVLGCHREWIFSPPAEDAVHRDILRSCAKKWNVRKSQCSTIGLKIHHLKCHTHILKSKWFIGDDLQMHSHQSKSSTFWNRFEAHCGTQTSLSLSLQWVWNHRFCCNHRVIMPDIYFWAPWSIIDSWGNENQLVQFLTQSHLFHLHVPHYSRITYSEILAFS